MKDKAILITGATSGIGFHTAQALAALQAAERERQDAEIAAWKARELSPTDAHHLMVEAIRARAGTGQREGFEDAGPLKGTTR